jgi:hypothetical protein
VDQGQRVMAQRALATFMGHYVRVPVGGGAAEILQTLSVGHLEVLPDPQPAGTWDFFLGTPPPPELASAIASGKRSPCAPYDLYESDQKVEQDENKQVEPAPAPPCNASAETLLKFGIDFPVPYDRHLTHDEEERMLCLRLGDLPGADIFAVKPDGTIRTPAEQMDFVSAAGFKPKKAECEIYLKTRALQFSSGTLSALTAFVQTSAKSEALKGYFAIADPDDGLNEKKRRTRLIEAGILTSDNAPHLVPLPSPERDDHRWGFITKELLSGSDMFKIMTGWVDLFFKNASMAMLNKAQDKLVAGRAYYCRALGLDERLYIYVKVDKSQSKAGHICDFVFKQSVGHNERTALVLISARCSPSKAGVEKCTAGDNYACCSHIVTGLCALAQLQSGVITAGNIGDGEAAWGGAKKTSSAVPVQSLHSVSLLVPGGAKLRMFTGFRPGSPPLQSAMAAFFDRLSQLAGPKVLPLIVERHHGVEIRRVAQLNPEQG